MKDKAKEFLKQKHFNNEKMYDTIGRSELYLHELMADFALSLTEPQDLSGGDIGDIWCKANDSSPVEFLKWYRDNKGGK